MRVIVIAIVISLVCSMGCKRPISQTTPNPGQPKGLTRCGAVEDLNALIRKDPSVKLRGDSIEVNIRDYLKQFNLMQGEEASVRGGRIIIPVVVHVLYNNSTTDPTNIPRARIDEQIQRLNDDFRRLNTDAGSVPAAFAGVAADSRIEFQLCRRDPSCNATDGITRTRVTATRFSPRDAKFSATGGVDAWNTSKYLNIWVVPQLCNDAYTVCTNLGSSSFPSYPSNEYGYVVAFNFMGNTSDPQYNLGRTAVHEFGHFYNLNHIWGDDCGRGNGICSAPGECSGTDNIGDTPNQGEMNYGTPTFPLTDCCSGTSPGVMFMNYMDYVDDRAMFMFTQGQVDRMVATLYTTMSGLLSSDALVPPPASSTADLFIGDTPEDIGNEPNNESDVFYTSQDIWVRNRNDGMMNMEHQNPVFRTTDPSNFVYVRIRNRGCATAASTNVTLYWAKASTGLSWPDPWNGGVMVGSALMGNPIGTRATGSIAGGSSTVLEFTWAPPNPADYASFGADRAHFCLLARIESPSGTETIDLWNNVKNYNNIAWKNIEVATTGDGREASMLMANYNNDESRFSLGFYVPRNEESVFNNYDSVFLQLHPKAFENWRSNGSKGNNIVVDQRGRIRLLNAAATINGIDLAYREVASMTVYFAGDRRRRGPHVYFLDVMQFRGDDTRNIVGAQRIWVKTFNR